MSIVVEPMRPTDRQAVCAIYAEGIADGQATFETAAPDWERFDAAHHEHSRWVARLDGEIVGWAAVSPVSVRAVYAGVAEASVYVSAGARGRGVGRRLLEALVGSTEEAGIWTLSAGIFPENEASIALHRRCGFAEVGIRRRIGRMDSGWRDVLLMERRSSTVGV